MSMRGTKHSVVAIQKVPRETVSSCGIIRGRLLRGHGLKGRVYRVEDMVEKSKPADAPSVLAIIGRYILAPRIFAELGVTFPDARGKVQLTDALRRVLEREPIYGYVSQGKRYDAGDKLGYLQATVELALRNPDLSRCFRAYLKSLRL
jgi:UTP--glucose-1-phosphate uridylyltransferase